MEYCVHTGSARVRPMATVCFKKKRDAQAFAREARRDGFPARMQTLSSSFRDAAPAAPTAAAPAPNKPAAAPVAGWWPFSKKAPKKLPRDPRRMAQTVMYIPSPSGRVNQVMRGAKRKRRRR